LDHINDKTRLKKFGLKCLLIEEEDVAILAWTLVMEKCGLSITTTRKHKFLIKK
jgi:hypothetical protein